MDAATREWLARAHAEWKAGGGREDDGASVVGLARGIFAVDVYDNSDRGVQVQIGGLAYLTRIRGEWHVWAAVTRRNCGSLLSALVALAAAGVPMRAEAVEVSLPPVPAAVGTWASGRPMGPIAHAIKRYALAMAGEACLLLGIDPGRIAPDGHLDVDEDGKVIDGR